MGFEDIEVNAPAPEAPKPPVQPTPPPAAAATDAGESFSADEFINFASSSREMPKGVDAAGTATEATADAAEPLVTGKKKHWYDRFFGEPGSDGPSDVEDSLEMDDEMYAMSAGVATELSDEIIPTITQGLHGAESNKSFKALDEQKEGVKKAWEMYLRYIKQKLTPLTYLLYKLFIVYGISIITGIFAYIGRVNTYGFHAPWGDAWIRKRDELQRKGKFGAKPLTNPATHTEAHEQEVNRNAVAQAQNVPPAAPAPTPAPKADNRPQKKCLETGQDFVVGQGFPKKPSAALRQYADSFIDRAAYMAYMNKHSLMGQQKTKNNGE